MDSSDGVPSSITWSPNQDPKPRPVPPVCRGFFFGDGVRPIYVIGYDLNKEPSRPKITAESSPNETRLT